MKKVMLIAIMAIVFFGGFATIPATASGKKTISTAKLARQSARQNKRASLTYRSPAGRSLGSTGMGHLHPCAGLGMR